MKTARIASISAETDASLRRATAASIAAAKDLVATQGPIRSSTPAGRLTGFRMGLDRFDGHVGMGFDPCRAGDD